MNQHQNSFRQLVVWQKSKELTLKIYEITKKFPKEEIYALISQLRMAAYSAMANIAEGNERHGQKDLLNFFQYSKNFFGRNRLLARSRQEFKLC